MKHWINADVPSPEVVEPVASSSASEMTPVPAAKRAKKAPVAKKAAVEKKIPSLKGKE